MQKLIFSCYVSSFSLGRKLEGLVRKIVSKWSWFMYILIYNTAFFHFVEIGENPWADARALTEP